MPVPYGYSASNAPSFKEPERGQQQEQMLVLPHTYEQVKGDRDEAHFHQQAVCMCPLVPGVRELALYLTPLNLLNKGIEHAQVWMVVPGKMPAVREQFAFQNGHEDEEKTASNYNIGEGYDGKFGLIPG